MAPLTRAPLPCAHRRAARAVVAVATAAAVVLLARRCDATAEPSTDARTQTTSTTPVSTPGLEGHTIAFFYLWYGSVDVDGAWQHWDHEVLPHWQESVRQQYPSGVRFTPPEELHAPFYPQRGPYSSRDVATLRAQMAELADAGVTAVALSWWGRPDHPGTHDTQGVGTDSAVRGALDAAAHAGLVASFHLEPYVGRNATTVAKDVVYIQERYGSHAAVHRDSRGRIVFFAYDSYHIPARQWARLLTADGDLSVRGTAADGAFIALWLDSHGGREASLGGFDGVYTYFASDGFSFGSRSRNWGHIADYCRSNDLYFVASVGPGYEDSRIRPWNRANSKPRENGAYYRRMLDAAVAARPHAISITSYNEWGEGTQIEPAVPYTVPEGAGLPDDVRRGLKLEGREYLDYGEGGPTLYLDITREYAVPFRASHAAAGGAADSDDGEPEL